MMKRKLIIVFVCIVLIVVLFFIGIKKVSNMNHQLYQQDNTIKALMLEKNNIEKEILAYKLDIEQLEYINDSIITRLNNTRKELGIKDNQILQLQNLKTEISTKDSIIIKDSIFKETFVRLDTVISNDWYQIKLSLESPNKLTIENQYTSDLDVIAYSKKEILGVPKKCFIGRMFQKKYNVIRVEVCDRNPFSKIKNSKFVIVE